MFQSKKTRWFVGILLAVLNVALFWYIYTSFITPINTEIETASATLETKEKLLATKEKEQSTLKQYTNSRLAQRKIPFDFLKPELMLTIERAELKANVHIMQMGIGTSTPLLPTSFPYVDAAVPSQVTLSQQEGQTQEVAQPIPLPEQLNVVNGFDITLQIAADSYEEFLDFMREIEKSERVLRISTYNLVGKEEKTSEELIDPNIPGAAPVLEERPVYQLVITAYHVPTLTELAPYDPNIAVPEGADRVYPFAQKQ
ncbi:MAG: hypothetical protein ACRC5C_09400 [Bacilli bacterium]